MRNSLTKLTLLQPTIFLLFWVGFTFKANAQCPVGETEVTISFNTSTYYYDIEDYYDLESSQWNYVIQGLASSSGPYSLEDTIVVCVPDGDLTIIGCGDRDVWLRVLIKTEITEDGSVNGCGSQNGCELYYDPIGWYFYTPTEECDDSTPNTILTFPVGCNISRVFTEGCTNEVAPNYNPCAIIDDGSCEIEASNNVCENAIPLNFDNNCTERILLTNVGNTFSGGKPSCIDDLDYDNYFIAPFDFFYEVTVPATGNFFINTNNNDNVDVAVYDTCGGNELSCSKERELKLFGLPPGETVILQLITYGNNNFNFCLQELPATVSNDLCKNATSLCGKIIEGTTLDASSESSDPSLSCGFSITSNPNSVWYSFVADETGNPITVTINIESCETYYYPYSTNYGLEAGVFSGICGSLVEVACNDPYFNNYYYQNLPDNLLVLNVEDPIPGANYYVYLTELYGRALCEFNISTSTGIAACCGPNIVLKPVCNSSFEDEFFVDIELDDLGNNPSGYTINKGDFADITTIGTVQIGPFPNGKVTINIEGKDELDCKLTYTLVNTCNLEIGATCENPEPFEITNTGYFVNVEENTFSGLVPDCLPDNYNHPDSLPVSDVFFELAVPETGSVKINLPSGHIPIIYSNCEDGEVFCSISGSENFELLSGLPAGETVILQFLSFELDNFFFYIEEILLPPENDQCVNALELCGELVNGSSENAQSSIAFYCVFDGKNGNTETVWYSFIADDSGLPITISVKDKCIGGELGSLSEIFAAAIFYGTSCNELEEIDCTFKYGIDFAGPEIDPVEINILTVENPEPGETYYLSLGGAFDSYCTFDIYTSTGMENCCNANYTVTPVCQSDQIYAEIQMNDLGNNPSGYSINGGTFPNITNTGLTTVGPLANEDTTISIVGLDTYCELDHLISKNCEAAPANSTCTNAEVYEMQAFGSCAYAFDYYWDAYDANNANLVLQPSCISDNQADNYYNLFYQVIVPNSGIIHYLTFEGGLAIYDFCGGEELYCAATISREVIFRDFTAGDTLIFQVLSTSAQTNFCIQEQPDTPVNDLCENALLLCEGTFSGNNINATFSADDGFNDCHAPNNTVWYSFVAESSNAVSFEFDNDDCINFFSGDGDMTFTIFSGECGGPYTKEVCRNISAPANSRNIVFDNPVAGEQYLIQISGEGDLKCSFDITVIEGVKSCCAPDISITPTCPTEEETDVFYVDIEVTDLGENPSGYVVNNGNYPNITTTGITTIGPFINGEASIKLEGLDVANCVIEETLTEYCNCSDIYVSSIILDELVLTGDSVTLFGSRPISGIGRACETIWVTDLDNPDESIIGIGEIFTFIPNSTAVIYGVTTCNSCAQSFAIYNITLLDYENCDDSIATTSLSGSILIWGGGYYNYSPQTIELYIELEDTLSCEFLYWVSDLSNPDQSIVSTEEVLSLDLYPGTNITYYGLVACEEDNVCVEEISIDLPLIDFYPPPPPPPPHTDGEDDPSNPGQPGTPGEPDPGEDGNLEPCPGISAGTLNTLDKYLCFGETPDLTLTDTEIPTGYSLYYAYHNSTDLSTTSFVYALSFDNLVILENVLPCATAIYLTAFVAPTVSSLSEINLSDACVEMSNTLEITYLCPVEIQVQEICNSNGTYNLAVTVTGGLPQVLGNLPFSIYGTVFKGNANHGQTFTITNLPDGSNYQIEAVDSEMCHDWVTGNVQCDKLPVELLTFEGEAQANGNLIKWSTATEIDNDYFSIESSSNGNDFTALGIVKGSGNTSSVSNYHFLDRQASNGITYYRLLQTDFNGNSTIEAVTEVSRGEASDINLLQTYPVPFLDELNLQVYSNSQSEVDINLLDVTGKEVIQQRFVLDKGLNEVSLPTKSLSKGLYLIALESKKSISYQKVIKD